MKHDSSGGHRLQTELVSWISQHAAGAQLPSTRSLASEYGVSPITVQKVIGDLASQGAIETRPGVGNFIRPRVQRKAIDFSWQTAALARSEAPRPGLPASLRAVHPGVVTLHSGYPHRDLLPLSLVRSALRRVARTDAVVDRPGVGGRPELQAWFAQEVATQARQGTAAPSAGDVLVVPGSQTALCMAFGALVGPGAPLVLESPTYWGALLAARKTGTLLAPVPSGPAGPDPAALDRVLSETGARAVYVQPTFASPSGALWDHGTKEAVLEIARRHGTFIIEDDSARDFSMIEHVPPPMAAMDDTGHVIYVRSLSKSTSPSLRVGAVIARGPARDRLAAHLSADAMYVSPVLQDAALDVVRQPGWRTHLKHARRDLATRRDLLLQSLTENAPSVDATHIPLGGLSLWARLPDGVDVERVVARCAEADVLVGPGNEWFPAEPTGPYLRLNYASPSADAFQGAAQVIEAAVQHASPG